MITVDENVISAINSPIRQIKARIELFSGSILLHTYSGNDNLVSFTIERSGGNSKLFGFGVLQKISVELLDKEREIEISEGQKLKVVYSIAE